MTPVDPATSGSVRILTILPVLVEVPDEPGRERRKKIVSLYGGGEGWRDAHLRLGGTRPFGLLGICGPLCAEWK